MRGGWRRGGHLVLRGGVSSEQWWRSLHVSVLVPARWFYWLNVTHVSLFSGYSSLCGFRIFVIDQGNKGVVSSPPASPL